MLYLSVNVILLTVHFLQYIKTTHIILHILYILTRLMGEKGGHYGLTKTMLNIKKSLNVEIQNGIYESTFLAPNIFLCQRSKKSFNRETINE